MSEFGYLRVRSVAEARRVAAEIDAALSRPLPKHTAEELERERVTLQLRSAFSKLDMRVLDSWSLTQCRRDVPLPAWRR